MIYKNPEIPSNYNSLLEIGDNYLIWTTNGEYLSNTSKTVYCQILKPDLVFKINNFRKDNISRTESTYYYDTNGNIDHIYTHYRIIPYTVDTNDIVYQNGVYDNYDYPINFICGFILVFCFVWTLNQLTKFIHKGGIFGSR